MEDYQSNRIIGKYDEGNKGPLLICTAGIHGNEIAGIKALELMLKMLEVEPITNDTFKYHGRFFAVKGNIQAIAEKVRFLERDMNRSWHKKEVDRVMQSNPARLHGEDLEMYHLLRVIYREIETYEPTALIFLDLHTTTATGGIFTIPFEDESSIALAKDLFAPVILGLLEGIEGTMMHYWNADQFPDMKTISLCFESGQHMDPLSVNRAIAAITNCMRAIGSVREQDVAHRHNYLLQTYSEGLPPLSRLISKHSIVPGDEFEMHPGFENFQNVEKGQVLAHDKKGPIQASTDAKILMPLYQKQGDDGFFLIKDEI